MALNVDLSAQGCQHIDPGHSGGPITIRFPNTTSLIEGAGTAILVAENDVTGLILTANPSSSDDRIMNPLDRSATPVSTWNDIVLPLGYFQFRLRKTATPDSKPLWYCTVPTLLRYKQSITLAAAATTFNADSTLIEVTGDGGGNTIATIAGSLAYAGSRITLLFVDANVTITDDNTHASNSIDLSASFTSADDTTLELVHDGTSWYEVSRSVN